MRNDTTGKAMQMGAPLYMGIAEAAEYVGIGEKKMREFANSADPPPYLLVGREKRLQVAALAPYFEARQEVRLSPALR